LKYPKPKKPKRKKKDDLDKLWAEIVKMRAGYKSELSGEAGKQIGGDKILHAHHIMRKPNRRLRYELKNGICLTAGEHKFGVHGSRAIEYEDRIKKHIGEETYEWLKSLRSFRGKTDMALVEIYLKDGLR